MTRNTRFLAGLLAIVALPTLAQAQSSSSRIGVLGGVNFSTLGGDDADDADFKTKVGFVGGLSLVKPLSGALALEVNGLYSMRGAKAGEEGVDVTFKIDYIEVPVMLRYDFSTGNSVTPHLAAGVNIGFQSSCKLEGSEGGVSASVSCSELESMFGGNIKSFDAGLVLGGGLDFRSGNRTFTVAARYNMGLTDISEDASIRNQGFQLMAGISIPLSR